MWPVAGLDIYFSFLTYFAHRVFFFTLYIDTPAWLCQSQRKNPEGNCSLVFTFLFPVCYLAVWCLASPLHHDHLLWIPCPVLCLCFLACPCPCLSPLSSLSSTITFSLPCQTLKTPANIDANTLASILLPFPPCTFLSVWDYGLSPPLSLLLPGDFPKLNMHTLFCLTPPAHVLYDLGRVAITHNTMTQPNYLFMSRIWSRSYDARQLMPGGLLDTLQHGKV